MSVTFEGPDADKIEKADMVMRTPRVETNQAGFSPDLATRDYKKVRPNTDTLELSFRIPDNQASGDYKLDVIRGITSGNNELVIQYNSPSDFSSPVFSIESPRRFIKPTIKGVNEVRRP